MGAGFCSLYREIHYFEVRYINVWVHSFFLYYCKSKHNISKLRILFFRYFMSHKTMFGMISDWGIMAPSWRPPKLYLLPILNKKTKFCYTSSGVKMSEIQTIFKVALNVQRKEKILFWMCMHVRKKKPSELLLLLHQTNLDKFDQIWTSLDKFIQNVILHKCQPLRYI